MYMNTITITSTAHLLPWDSAYKKFRFGFRLCLILLNEIIISLASFDLGWHLFRAIVYDLYAFIMATCQIYNHHLMDITIDSSSAKATFLSEAESLHDCNVIFSSEELSVIMTPTCVWHKIYYMHETPHSRPKTIDHQQLIILAGTFNSIFTWVPSNLSLKW